MKIYCNTEVWFFQIQLKFAFKIRPKVDTFLKSVLKVQKCIKNTYIAIQWCYSNIQDFLRNRNKTKIGINFIFYKFALVRKFLQL